jgi:hypothetical protein
MLPVIVQKTFRAFPSLYPAPPYCVGRVFFVGSAISPVRLSLNRGCGRSVVSGVAVQPPGATLSGKASSLVCHASKFSPLKTTAKLTYLIDFIATTKRYWQDITIKAAATPCKIAQHVVCQVSHID